MGWRRAWLLRLILRMPPPSLWSRLRVAQAEALQNRHEFLDLEHFGCHSPQSIYLFNYACFGSFCFDEVLLSIVSLRLKRLLPGSIG
jgi:hypothetical protein